MSAEPLALLAALLWGGSGLFAGVLSRSTSAILVALVAQSAGGVVLVAIALASAEPATLRTVVAGGVGGMIGGVGLVWLYQAFAGPAVGLAAPLAATGILLPVIVGLGRGEAFGGPQALGACVLLAGLAAVLHRPSGAPLEARTLRLAAGAALSFGIFYLALDAGAGDSAAWVTVFARAGAGVVLATLVLRSSGLPRAPHARWMALGALAGVADAVGNLSYAAASAVGELSVVSLLSAAYPAVTVLLAVTLLGERITATRAAGVLATVVGLGLVGA